MKYSPQVYQLATVRRVTQAELNDVTARMRRMMLEERKIAASKWNAANPLPKNPAKWQIEKQAGKAIGNSWNYTKSAYYALDFKWVVWDGKAWVTAGKLRDTDGYTTAFSYREAAVKWIARQKRIIANRANSPKNGTVKVKLPGGQVLTLKKGQYTLL